MSTILSLLGFREVSDTTGSGWGRHGRNSKGFTLIELLVVIAIISILATLLLLQLGVARAKARDAKRIADVNQVRSAVELYFDDNGNYLSTNDMTGLTPTYLLNVPKDPLATGCAATYNGTAGGAAQCYGYAYTPAANATKYQVWAELEQNNRAALASDADLNTTAGGASPLTFLGGATVVGATEACTSAANDCVFDLGQK